MLSSGLLKETNKRYNRVCVCKLKQKTSLDYFQWLLLGGINLLLLWVFICFDSTKRQNSSSETSKSIGTVAGGKPKRNNFPAWSHY